MSTTAKPLVDGADRRVAGLVYAPAVGSLSATAALAGDPALFGPLAWWWPAAFGAVCGLLLAKIPLDRQAPAAAVAVLAMWSGDGAWVAWGWANGWRAGGYWLAGAAGLVVASCAGYVFATPADFGAPMHPAGPAAPGPAGFVEPPDEWGDLIERASKGTVTGVTTDRVEHWPGGTGYTAYLQCGPDGSTWEDVKKCEPRLGGLLNLPRGGGVTVLTHDEGGARAVRVDVLETDAMATPVPYPFDLADLTGHSDDEEW